MLSSSCMVRPADFSVTLGIFHLTLFIMLDDCALLWFSLFYFSHWCGLYWFFQLVPLHSHGIPLTLVWSSPMVATPLQPVIVYNAVVVLGISSNYIVIIVALLLKCCCCLFSFFIFFGAVYIAHLHRCQHPVQVCNVGTVTSFLAIWQRNIRPRAAMSPPVDMVAL